LVITDPTRSQLLRFSARHTPAHRGSQTLLLRTKLIEAGVELGEHSEVSLYFRDPDGARLELIPDPLGERYGAKGL